MRAYKRLIINVLTWCVVAVLILLGSCRQKVDKPRVALVMKSLANEFFKTMEEGARKHHQEHAEEYELIVVGIKNEQDVAKQIDLVELMIAQGADAIVIAPADSKALVPVCKRAIKAGIIVVNIDNKFDAAVLADQGVKIPFVGPDNRKGARLAGEYLAARLTQTDKVAIIEGAPNAFNGIQRKLGFEDAMKTAGINIVSSQSGYWEMAKANQCVSAILTEYSDVAAVLCANDSMALGAIAAIKAAGPATARSQARRRPTPKQAAVTSKSDDILVVGFDNISAVQGLLKEGKILCTVDQHADKLALYGIEYAIEMLKGKGTPSDKETPVELITAETLK